MDFKQRIFNELDKHTKHYPNLIADAVTKIEHRQGVVNLILSLAGRLLAKENQIDYQAAATLFDEWIASKLPTRECPKCGKGLINFTQHYNAFTTVRVFDGKVVSLKYQDGETNYIEGDCVACGHVWQVEGAESIFDVVPEAIEGR